MLAPGLKYQKKFHILLRFRVTQKHCDCALRGKTFYDNKKDVLFEWKGNLLKIIKIRTYSVKKLSNWRDLKCTQTFTIFFTVFVNSVWPKMLQNGKRSSNVIVDDAFKISKYFSSTHVSSAWKKKIPKEKVKIGHYDRSRHRDFGKRNWFVITASCFAKENGIVNLRNYEALKKNSWCHHFYCMTWQLTINSLIIQTIIFSWQRKSFSRKELT